jgi:Uri superfamily endonuclease
MDKGIYCLVFNNTACTVRVGALGEIAFRKGWHIYVGSALGSGGLARLERHIALSRNKDKHPTWHVDYLSESPSFCLRSTISALTGEPLECRLAAAFGGKNIPGFGCSDCGCPSHLFYRQKNPVREVEEAFRSLGLAACTKTLMNREHSKGYL